VEVSRRYESLDAWRGIAALSVLVFHCGNAIVGPETFAGRMLLAGWLGVFLFFPISGYCILAALSSPHNSTIGAFLKRRWRRIVPPYWASIAFAVAIGLAALPFNRGSIDAFLLSPEHWASVATLTQVFTSARNTINPVYWSLCYEEQFYVVLAMLLAAPARWRPSAIALLAGAAAVYVSPAWPWRIEGLFLQYWLCFALGCAAYLWVHERDSRRWAIAILILATAIGIRQGDAALLTSAATATAMAALAPYDAALARTRAVGVLMSIGTFSFSLYLTHVPVGGRVTNLLHRFDLPAAVIVSISSAISLAAAWLFFLAIERRTLQRRPTAAAEQVAAAA
jgi:peptidoglycan/LPS O-acetylase OafA/YrhL